MSPAIAEGIEWVSNGTVRLVIDGGQYRLRRPKIGEFRKLRELLWEMQDKAQAILSERNEKGGAPDEPAETADDEDTDALIKRADEALEATRSLMMRTEELYIDWNAEVFAVLSDKALPEDRDSWPLFFFDVEFISKLIEHWRTVPLALGGDGRN